MDTGTAVNARARWLLWGTALGVGVTRWLALSRTLWDWDEALFVLAMRDYDVRAFHPQPPGFPLFIGLARLVPVLDDFHALQAIVFLASLFVFPAAYFLARELRAPEFVAFASALLLAFFPNVWFYGGTAFSDVPSIVLALAACALLLRGRRSASSLIAGAAILGIAAGIRPQNLLIAFVPFVLAFRGKKRVAVLGAVITILIVVASYGTAAAESGGWEAYRAAVAQHERYIRETDSFLSPIRPSLLRVADDFFLRPFRAPAINVLLLVLMFVGAVRRRAHALLAIAIFGPFLIFAWLFLDFHSTSRFSIGYMPMFAILAAEGIDAAGRARAWLLAGVSASLIAWTWPALRTVHTTPSPPVAAIESIGSGTVYVDERLGPHAAVLLHEYKIGNPDRAGVLYLSEGRGAIDFTRSRARLAGIARARYFEVSITPIGR